MSETMTTEVPEGFKPAGFKGSWLHHGGPFFTKKLDDHYVVGLRMDEKHINYIDIAHGSVLSMLADVSLSFQPFKAETPNLNVSTVNLNTNFLAPAKLGDWLEGHARIDRMGKKLAYVSGDIRCEDKVLMTMTGVFNIIR